jgi:hypothetical protein
MLPCSAQHPIIWTNVREILMKKNWNFLDPYVRYSYGNIETSLAIKTQTEMVNPK